MFDSLGRAIAHAPRRTILVWLVVAVGCLYLAVGGTGGDDIFSRLTTGAASAPGSESSGADSIMEENSTSGASLNLAISGVDPTTTDLTKPMAHVRSSLMAVPGVASVIDPFIVPDGPDSTAAAPLVAADHDGFLMVVELDTTLADPAEEQALADVEDLLRAVPHELSEVAPGVTGRVGGTSLIVREINDQVEQDLRTGETIALPFALLVMVLVFGGFLAAAMPMVGAVASIAVGLGSVYGFTYLMDMNSSVLNIVTLLGLGLSIDYGLLIVSRFREELHRLLDSAEGVQVRRRKGDAVVETALRATISTAGRTVAFSALTVAISVSGLLAFSPEILRSFGLAGAAVVLIAVATALTLVPALLCLTGRRLVRPGSVARVPGLRAVLARAGDVTAAEGVFSRLAGWVQNRPWRVLVGVTVLLVLLAMPASHIDLRNSTIELLPVGSDQRAYVSQLTTQYPASTTSAVIVLAEGALKDVEKWSEATLANLPDVASVDPPAVLGPYVVVGVRPDSADPGGLVARGVVQAVRDADAPFRVWVTGRTANQVDFVQALKDRAWWAVGIVAIATLLLLFLMTGSVVVPIKALLMNVVSLAATIGVLVWVFQDGHLAGLLGFESTGGVETYVMALIIAFGYGLAMDYEVFLLSRVKELHDAGSTNDDAVRLGLQRSGRIITSAAGIIIVVFSGFVFGDLLVIKEVGFSLAVAVLIDATLVRMLLVPATMTLLGRANWWAPKPLRRLHGRMVLVH